LSWAVVPLGTVAHAPLVRRTMVPLAPTAQTSSLVAAQTPVRVTVGPAWTGVHEEPSQCDAFRPPNIGPTAQASEVEVPLKAAAEIPVWRVVDQAEPFQWQVPVPPGPATQRSKGAAPQMARNVGYTAQPGRSVQPDPFHCQVLSVQSPASHRSLGEKPQNERTSVERGATVPAHEVPFQRSSAPCAPPAHASVEELGQTEYSRFPFGRGFSQDQCEQDPEMHSPSVQVVVPSGRLDQPVFETAGWQLWQALAGLLVFAV
jgi:hypothetical protein